MCKRISCRTLGVVLLIAFAGITSSPLFAQSPPDETATVTTSLPDSPLPAFPPDQPSIKPVRLESEQPDGVDWGHLVLQSVTFLSVENAFRCSKEQGTRDAFSTPFFRGYLNSVENLHGWNDGDPFYVNYIGHTMQGAVSGDIWTHNDRAYRDIEFGKNRKYWKGKLRGAAYSFVYSAMFEIGPVSEATIGNAQAYYPEQGFVDYVVTPVVGLGWSIGEDAIDQYLIRLIEAHTRNNWLRLLARGGLNPARSFANAMEFKPPWHRDNRPGIRSYDPADSEFMAALKSRNTSNTKVVPRPGVAPFEFTITPQVRTYLGDDHQGPCAGGGGSAAFRLASQWQLVADFSGCKLLGLEQNLSGDSLSYLAGARWTPKAYGRWIPHAQLLIGGTKLTQELVDPELKKELYQKASRLGEPKPLHDTYSQHWETNGFTIQVGTGVDVKLNNALAIRVASLDYSHSWTSDLNGINYQSSLQLTSGLVLHVGTW
jgi:hypothetical protein